jgi:Protein of unknown function (DUF3592)
MSGDAVFLVVLVLATVALAYLAVQVGKQLYWSLRVQRYGLRATGEVIGRREMKTMDNERRGVRYTIRFTTADGREVTFEDQMMSGGWQVGSSIEVLYHPDRPEQAEAVGKSGLPRWWGSAFGMGVVAFLLVCTVAALAAVAGVF